MTSYKSHIKSYDDLITPYEATRAGFIEITLEKNRKATPFVEEAKALRVAALEAKKPIDLLKLNDIQGSILTAAGLSDKALNHFTETDKQKAIKTLIDNFLKPAGDKFVDELVYRFLLTRGDTLGGMMRNLAGAVGERKFIRSVIATLSIQKVRYYWFNRQSEKWLSSSSSTADIENCIKGLSWKNKSGNRILLLNITVPNVGKNIDLCLINGSYKDLGNDCYNKKKYIKEPKYFIALGELKGGIDPAGADEHWKTANTALDRIRQSFRKSNLIPKTFFIGAAIEISMSKEIFNQLEKGILTNAANLTDEKQVFSLCKWLVNM